MIQGPASYTITADVDWASDHCIRLFVELCNEYDVKPTIFATHASEAVTHYLKNDCIEVGLHPNFLPGSDHGDSVETVVDHVTALYPQARCFRSHHFCDSAGIQQAFRDKGFEYDSNICLHGQPGIAPLHMASGLKRYPVFFEDDDHWLTARGEDLWDMRALAGTLQAPGLKIFNFHPFFVAANIAGEDQYKRSKGLIKTFSEDDEAHGGKGAGTLLRELLAHMDAEKWRHRPLGELHDSLFDTSTIEDDKGRVNVGSEEQKVEYAGMTREEKQEYLRKSFDERDKTDIYATSRDFYLRELEIQSIAEAMPSTGKVLDFGCGNGYTITSLASRLPGLDMTGIDFSSNLIEGANIIAKDYDLQSNVRFVCADVLKYVAEVEDDSMDCVITERFIQNMPDTDVQLHVLKEISRILAPGGRLLMCEGYDTGLDKLNELRSSVGLSVIPKTASYNVSAIRITDEFIERCIAQTGLTLERVRGYNYYFAISRVLHPAIIAPEPPKFDSRFNEYAYNVQKRMPFESGLGGNHLWVFRKR